MFFKLRKLLEYFIQTALCFQKNLDFFKASRLIPVINK